MNYPVSLSTMKLHTQKELNDMAIGMLHPEKSQFFPQENDHAQMREIHEVIEKLRSVLGNIEGEDVFLDNPSYLNFRSLKTKDKIPLASFLFAAYPSTTPSPLAPSDFRAIYDMFFSETIIDSVSSDTRLKCITTVARHIEHQRTYF